MLSNPEAQTTFDPKETADKYYFSAFFNEAIRNAATILKHTGQLINAEYPGSDFPKDTIEKGELHKARILQEAKKVKENPLLAPDIARHLKRRFTVLASGAFEEGKIKGQVCFLQFSLKLAKDYRNCYSHQHYLKPITVVDALLEDGKKEKDNRNRSESGLDDFQTCLNKCFKRAVMEAKSRFQFSDDIEARFVTAAKADKEGADRKITEHYALFDADGKRLSDNGMHFLLCLLLTKDRANQYLSRIQGFKGTHKEELLATRQIFTLFCLRLPKTQLVSEVSEQALTLDLISYLAQCPDSLYKVLDRSDQQRFITRESADQDAPPSKMQRKLDRAYYFLARFIEGHGDFELGFQVQLGKWRRAQYQNKGVERHIEQNVYKFGQLREIRKEDANERAHRAAYADAGHEAGEKTDENHLKTRLARMLTPKESGKEWVKYAPHYARHPHAFSVNSSVGKGVPKIIVDRDRVKNYPADRILQQAPDFVLSNRVLSLIAMLLLLNEKHGDENYRIKALLEHYRESVKDFLEEIESKISTGKVYAFEELEGKAQEHGLKARWLPRQLIKALMDNQKPFSTQIQAKLDAEIKRTADYWTFLDCIKKIRESQKGSDECLKYKRKIDRLKGRYDRKPGAVASDFLRDIWRFTERSKGNMPHASQYQNLQRKLAYYPVHRQDLDRDFKDLDFHKRNPFYKVLFERYKGEFFGKRVKAGPREKGIYPDDLKPKYKAIQDVYTVYLREKKGQLEKLRKDLEAKPEKWKDYYGKGLFALELPVEKNAAGELEYKDLRKGVRRKRYLQNLRKALEPNAGKTDPRAKTTHLGVPPGFFVGRFIRFCEEHELDLTTGLDRLEPVKLIERYLEKEGAGTQKFYNLERRHSFEKQQGKPPITIRGTADAIHKQVHERMKSAADAQKKKLKEIIDREAGIRQAQAMDRVLWLCAKKWLDQHFGLKGETEPNVKETGLHTLKLRDYAAGYHDQGKHNPLEQIYPFNIPHRQDGHSFSIEIETKVRDIGKVHAWLRDKRLSTLFKLLAYPADRAGQGEPKKTFKLKYAELVEELENYEKCRMESLRCIQEFEQSIPYTLDDKDKEKGYVPFEKILKQRYAEGTPDYILCLALRNSWMHNKYPFWKGEKKTAKLFDIDNGLKGTYLKYCADMFAVNQDNHITLYGIKKCSPAGFWYERTRRFFKGG